MKRKFKEIQQIFEKNRGEGENLRKKEGKANRAMIAALRESGMSYQEISEITGMTYNSLANSYSKYRKEKMLDE